MSQFAGEFPKTTLDDALPHLRRPFTEHAVRFKIQSAWDTDRSKGALVVTYIDARTVAERLNHVVGGAWSEDYREGRTPNSEVCLLTVLGVTRQDVGEASGIALQKALKSDALKRAAVKFGVGVSVYASPVLMLNPDDGLKPKRVKDKNTYALTEKGETLCRKRYAEWLKQKGEATFGEPLDHGDIAGSQGDVDVELSIAASEDEQRQEQAGEQQGSARALTPAELQKLKKGIEDEGRDLLVLMGAIGVEFETELTTAHAWEIWEMLGKSPKAAASRPRRRS